MTGLPTPDHSRRRAPVLVPVLILFVTLAACIPTVRDWTDVKFAVACAAVAASQGRRSHLIVGLCGVFLGHGLLGWAFGVGGWPPVTWFIVGGIAIVETAALVRILGSTVADSGAGPPSRRLAVFVLGIAGLSIVAGSLESWLIGLTGARSPYSSLDIGFGLAVASCLAAIAATRRGSQWLKNTRPPGSELLAPLLVVLVTLVAVQATRQVWAQRRDDRLEVVARSIHATLAARWDREAAVLGSKAEVIAPIVALDPTTFKDLIDPYLVADDAAVAAVLGTRDVASSSIATLGSTVDPSWTGTAIADGMWNRTEGSSDVIVREPDEPLILRRIDMVSSISDEKFVLTVAYSLPELIKLATNDVLGRFDDVTVGLLLGEGSASTRIWPSKTSSTNRDEIPAGVIPVGNRNLTVTVAPTSAFSTSTADLWIAAGVEITLGSILCGVLVAGANAQFTMAQERRRREKLLEAALDATPGSSIVYDKDFRVLAANRPVRQEFGDQIPGLEVARVFGLDGDGGRRRMVEDVLRHALNGQAAQIEITEDLQPTNGSNSANVSRMKIIELSAYPVVSPGGEPVGFLHSVDATERRSLAMRSAQSERMESLGALAGGLAHDFNNLLFVTLGNLQLMAMNDTVAGDEKLSKFVSRSMSAVERGAEITKSLLAVARSQPLEESAVSLSDLIKGILPLVRQALGSGRRVEVDIQDPNLQLMVDSGRLSSCILNLAFNSRDAMGPNGVLRITARLDEATDMIELVVADDGAGMPVDVVARAFEPFFTTKSPGSGTGLGLATVYAFAKQSGGTAYLESSLGVGTTVTLVLPRYTGQPVAEAVVAARRSGRRVVVADDELSLAEMVAAWLIDMGIDARFATSPKAALELIETFEPDVLVSDANFGEELDGIELARLGTAIVPEMAVIFMTGFSNSMRELQELGERTLAKPFSREDLYGAVLPLIAEEESHQVPTPSSSSANRKKSRRS